MFVEIFIVGIELGRIIIWYKFILVNIIVEILVCIRYIGI